MLTRLPRPPNQHLLAGYPGPVRRLIEWYDGLSDWGRVKYALVGMLFLLASAGYLLGLTSSFVLERVEADEEAQTAPPAATEPTAEPSDAQAQPTPMLAGAAPIAPAQSRPVVVPTPFSAPEIVEPPAVPRSLAVNRQAAPAAPAAPGVRTPPHAPATSAPHTPTPAAPKPRRVEDATPEAPAVSIATPTPGVARPTLQPPPAAPIPSARPRGRP